LALCRNVSLTLSLLLDGKPQTFGGFFRFKGGKHGFAGVLIRFMPRRLFTGCIAVLPTSNISAFGNCLARTAIIFADSYFNF
jgi:hypothetical protein